MIPADLGPMPGSCLSPSLGLVKGHFRQEGQVKRLVEVQDSGEYLFDAGRFNLGQPTATDCGFDLGNFTLGDGFQGPKTFHQPAKGPFRVGVGGVLGQYGKDQLVGRVQAWLFRKGAVLVRHEPDGLGYPDARLHLFGGLSLC